MIKNFNWDRLRGQFSRCRDSTWQSVRAQLENLFLENQKSYLFREQLIEHSWRELLRHALPLEQQLSVPTPVVIKREDENAILMQLRYILKQNSQLPQLAKLTVLFLLQLLQQLSPLSEFHMRLYIALSEKGRNSVSFGNATHMQSKQSTEFESFQINKDIKLIVTGE